MLKKVCLFLLTVIVIAGLALTSSSIRGWLFGPGKYAGPALPPSTLAVPHERTIAWKGDSVVARQVIDSWGQKPLTEAKHSGKGGATRVILGHLLARNQVAETNALILSMVPWGVAGTSGWNNPRGDYDFEESVYTTILWLFKDQPDVLTPPAREHIISVLLTEEGNAFRTVAPRTLGLFEETENHMLMTEGSRYLKNRWLAQHGDASGVHDNLTNGMEANLLALIGRMRTAGFHEFNSQPYIGYTILGLLNLEAFASDPVRAAARDLLDYMNWTYALGAFRLRHFAPFRRRYEYAGMTSLTAGYQTAFMTTWLSFDPDVPGLPELDKGGLSHAVIAAALPYRPADAVVKMIFDKSPGYFVRLGHGYQASPEIFSAGPGYLLSAGGVNRGERSILVALPIVLLTERTGTKLEDTFNLAGPGKSFRDWNDTGVYRNFACAAGPVHLAPHAPALAADANWTIFAPAKGLLLAVHSTSDLGIMAVFPGGEPNTVLAAINSANADPAQLRTTFQFPGGPRLVYDVTSPKDRWVMISDDGKALDRDFDRWPLLGGEL